MGLINIKVISSFGLISLKHFPFNILLMLYQRKIIILRHANVKIQAECTCNVIWQIVLDIGGHCP